MHFVVVSFTCGVSSLSDILQGVLKKTHFFSQRLIFYPIIMTIICQLAKVSIKKYIDSSGTAISDASNLCTVGGGDQNREFRGNSSFLRDKAPGQGVE